MSTDVVVPADIPGVKLWENAYNLGTLLVKRTN